MKRPDSSPADPRSPESLRDLPPLPPSPRLMDAAVRAALAARDQGPAEAGRRVWAYLAAGALAATAVAAGIVLLRPTGAPPSSAIATRPGPIPAPVVARASEPAPSPVPVIPLSSDLTIRRAGGVDSQGALGDGDLVEASAARRGELALGTAGRVILEPKTRVRFRRSPASVPVLDVEWGRVETRLAEREQGQPPAVAFEHRGHQVVVLRGSVGVLRSADDRLSVAALSGEAQVLLDGRPVSLAALSYLQVGSTGVPQPLPPALELELQKLQGGGPRKDTVVVQGRTHPEVLLIINGLPVPVAADGRFVATVQLDRGRTVRASATDVAGRAAQAERQVLGADVQWRFEGPG